MDKVLRQKYMQLIVEILETMLETQRKGIMYFNKTSNNVVKILTESILNKDQYIPINERYF